MIDSCTTTPITHYEVQLNYTSDGHHHSITSNEIPNDITFIFMSQYFRGHPMPNVEYTVTIFALNEGGYSTPSTPRTIGM